MRGTKVVKTKLVEFVVAHALCVPHRQSCRCLADAATCDYEDLVTRSALQNAASISALMLTTEAMICEIPEKKSAGPQMPDHGGMDM